MSMTFFVTALAGLFGSIGIVFMFLGGVVSASERRAALWKIGGVGMATGGLVLALSSLVGWAGNDELFGGLLMILFGSGIDATLRKKTPPAETDKCAG